MILTALPITSARRFSSLWLRMQAESRADQHHGATPSPIGGLPFTAPLRGIRAIHELQLATLEFRPDETVIGRDGSNNDGIQCPPRTLPNGGEAQLVRAAEDVFSWQSPAGERRLPHLVNSAPA